MVSAHKIALLVWVVFIAHDGFNDGRSAFAQVSGFPLTNNSGCCSNMSAFGHVPDSGLPNYAPSSHRISFPSLPSPVPVWQYAQQIAPMTSIPVWHYAQHMAPTTSIPVWQYAQHMAPTTSIPVWQYAQQLTPSTAIPVWPPSAFNHPIVSPVSPQSFPAVRHADAQSLLVRERQLTDLNRELKEPILQWPDPIGALEKPEQTIGEPAEKLGALDKDDPKSLESSSHQSQPTKVPVHLQEKIDLVKEKMKILEEATVTRLERAERRIRNRLGRQRDRLIAEGVQEDDKRVQDLDRKIKLELNNSSKRIEAEKESKMKQLEKELVELLDPKK